MIAIALYAKIYNEESCYYFKKICYIPASNYLYFSTSPDYRCVMLDTPYAKQLPLFIIE